MLKLLINILIHPPEADLPYFMVKGARSWGCSNRETQQQDRSWHCPPQSPGALFHYRLDSTTCHSLTSSPESWGSGGAHTPCFRVHAALAHPKESTVRALGFDFPIPARTKKDAKGQECEQ